VRAMMARIRARCSETSGVERARVQEGRAEVVTPER
jgi:hypothetical protein